MNRLRESHDVLFDPELWSRPADLASAVSQARAIIIRNQTQVTAELINAAPNLEIIARAGAGLDNVDTDAASKTGIVVTYTPSENSVSVAELVLGLMLTLVRRIPAAWQDTRSGGWDRAGFTGGELFQKTLGIVGLGRIGRLVAERAKPFGMTIIAHDDFIDPTDPFLSELDIRLLPLDELLSEAGFVSVHVPLNEQTRDMFSTTAFNRMKNSAFFINASRGEVVDESALISALKQGTIAGAALDVRDSEPPADGPLSEMDNVMLTPHIGAFTHEAQERVVESVCRDVNTVLAGSEAVNAFNFPLPQRNAENE